VCVAGLFPWSWRADLWAREGIPVVRGPALSRQASPGGTAQHATIDAQPSAVRRRGGRRPQASGSPAERRAPRALRRRRWPLTRPRAARRAPGQQTNRQDHVPELGTHLADTAHRDGGAARCPAPAVQQRVAVDRALSDSAAQRRRAVALTSGQTATPHQAPTRSRRPSGPGLGTMVRGVWRYARPDMTRCPRGQEVVSSGRLVTGAQASAGNRSGTSGATLGQASLTGAFAAAAGRLWRHQPAGQPDRARLAPTPGPGHARTIVAHTCARAVSDRRTRETAVERQTCLPGSGRGAEAPHAALAAPGLRRAYGALLVARRHGTPRSTAARSPRARGR
jgi:hypothetical protein